MMGSTESNRPPLERGATELLKGKPVSGDRHSRVERERAAEVSVGFFQRVWNQVGLFFSLLKHYRRGQYRSFPWMAVGAIALGLLYLVNPFDLVPDVLFPFGEIDDGAVLFFAWKMVERDLKRFVEWKGLDPRQYF